LTELEPAVGKLQDRKMRYDFALYFPRDCCTMTYGVGSRVNITGRKGGVVMCIAKPASYFFLTSRI
jgi:hypothetical protein